VVGKKAAGDHVIASRQAEHVITSVSYDLQDVAAF
jgi:hypothetical protein